MPNSGIILRLSGIDWGIVGVYFVALAVIGRVSIVRQQRGERGQIEQYLLAGRQLTLPLFLGTLVSTWYGGLLGVSEIAFQDGLAAWLTQGGFWYGTYFVFAFFLAERLNRSGQVTLPDQMGILHGPVARVFSSVLNYINVVPISYMLSLGLVIHLFTGWSVVVGMLLGIGFVISYSLAGGFRSVVFTEQLQFWLMCTAVGVLMICAVTRLGGGEFLTSHLPPTHFNPLKGASFQELSVWAIIAFSTLVDPNFYQRCYAAKSPKIARRGILWATLIWAMFDVCSVFSAMYARAALPHADARLAYVLLADHVLPVGLKGIFVVGLLSTIMSTIDSYCFVGATGISHDLWRRTIDPSISDKKLVSSARYGFVVTAVIAVILAFASGGSFRSIWKTIGSLSTSAILVPMMLGLLGWRPAGAGVASMVGGSAATLGWAAMRRFVGGATLKLEALVPGLVASVGSYVLVGLLQRRKDPALRDP